MRKVTFKQALISVFSVLSVGCLATGTSLLNDSKPTVHAEAQTVQTKSIVSVGEGVTVTDSVTNGGKTALNISSTQAYSGKFDGTFYGNMDLKYRFPNQYKEEKTNNGDSCGEFMFTIADSRPDYAEENTFSVIVKPHAGFGAKTYVYYTGETLGASARNGVFGSSKGNNLPTESVTNGNNYYAGTWGQFNNTTTKNTYNSLKLTWDEEGVLTVGYFYSGETDAIVAKFNGVVYKKDTENAWGLPKIAFPEGYTISFSSDYTEGLDTDGDGTPDDYGTDVNFISLNGNSLGGSSVEVTSSTQTVTYDGIVKKENDVIEVEQYSSNLKTFAYGSVQTLLPWQVADDDTADDPTYTTVGYFNKVGALQDATLGGETVDLTKAGDYAVTAQGTALTVRVLPVVNAFSLVNTTADKSIVAITTNSETKGILISSKAAYTGALNGVFSGNLELLYRFPNQYAVDSGNETTAGGDKLGNFTFTIADASDPENVEKQFTFTYTKTNASMVVGYKSSETAAYYYATTWTSNNNVSSQIDYGGYACGYAPKYNNADDSSVYNSLILEWEGDILTIYACNNTKKANKQIVAQFNGKEYKKDSTDKEYGLPKMNFPNGYTVSFSSNYDAGLDTDGDGNADDYGTDVNFISLNGVALGQDNYTVTVGETTASVNGQKVTAIGTDVTAVDLTTIATYTDASKNTVTAGLTTKNVSIGEAKDGKVTVSHNPFNQKDAPSVELVVSGTTCTVTYRVDGTESTASVAQNGKITLESATLANKMFIGWKIGEDLYAAGDEYEVTGDVTVTAVGVSFGIIEGASVRKASTEGKTGGMRFAGSILTADAELVTEYGMCLKAADSEAEGHGVTVKAENKLTASSAQKVAGSTYDANRTYFTAVLTNIAKANYSKDVTAVTYITVTYKDGDSATFYSEEVTRNVKAVAQAAINAGETGDMLDEYVK